MRTSVLLRKLRDFYNSPTKWTVGIRENNQGGYCVLGAMGTILYNDPWFKVRKFDEDKRKTIEDPYTLRLAKALDLPIDDYPGASLARWNNGNTFQNFKQKLVEACRKYR